MGRKTFESIGKPLPGRENIVVTRDPNYRRDGIRVVHDTESALHAAGVAPEIMVIGGAELFRAFLPRAGRIHLTRVHGNIAGDVMWPALDERDLAGGGTRSSPGRRASCICHDVRGVGKAVIAAKRRCAGLRGRLSSPPYEKPTRPRGSALHPRTHRLQRCGARKAGRGGADHRGPEDPVRHWRVSQQAG